MMKSESMNWIEHQACIKDARDSVKFPVRKKRRMKHNSTERASVKIRSFFEQQSVTYELQEWIALVLPTMGNV
jgi:hypothetical protein